MKRTMNYNLRNLPVDQLVRIFKEPRSFAWDSDEFELYLYLVRLGEGTGEPNGTVVRLIEWALDNLDEDTETAVDAAERITGTLRSINCSGCFAPSGLIYNHDLGREAGEHWAEIDDALEDYEDSTWTPWHPQSGLSVSQLVWFTYEWDAHRLAALMEAVFDIA